MARQPKDEEKKVAIDKKSGSLAYNRLDIDEHEPVYVANAQLEELPALLDARENQYLYRIVSPLHCF